MKYLLLPALLLSCLFTFSQNKEEQVKKVIFEKDSLFWIDYNNCNIDGMGSVLTDDIEFYHDKGGPTFGRDSLIGSISKNLCGNDNFRLRRAAVPGTVHVFVMNKNDVPYGAIISGQHVFYINEKGKKEYLDGLARFAQLWILKDGTWKMSRILSYDHGEAPKNIMDQKVVNPAILNGHAGKYKGSKFTIEAVNDNGVLKLKVDGKEFILRSRSDDVYYVTERNLEFIFSRERLTVLENGGVVEEATRI